MVHNQNDVAEETNNTPSTLPLVIHESAKNRCCFWLQMRLTTYIQTTTKKNCGSVAMAADLRMPPLSQIVAVTLNNRRE